MTVEQIREQNRQVERGTTLAILYLEKSVSLVGLIILCDTDQFEFTVLE